MPMPDLYRKKPVVIEATQWDGTAEGATPIIDWILSGDGIAGWRDRHVQGITPYRPDDINEIVTPAHIWIRTLEGEMRADPNDWLIRGVIGEFYPVKPAIFSETYEPVQAHTSS